MHLSQRSLFLLPAMVSSCSPGHFGDFSKYLVLLIMIKYLIFFLSCSTDESVVKLWARCHPDRRKDAKLLPCRVFPFFKRAKQPRVAY